MSTPMSTFPYPLTHAEGRGFFGLTQPLFSIYLTLAISLIALLVGLNTPHVFPLSFLEEDGPVETMTVVFYVLVPFFLWRRLPALSGADKLAITVILLSFAAREADLHKALFGMSILKARFYNHFATGLQMAEALAVLLPIAASLLWLAFQHGWRWLSRPTHWRAPMVTVATFAVVLVVSKLMDRAPDSLLSWSLLTDMPQAVRCLLLAQEELLEMALPVLAIVSMWQGSMGASAADSQPA